MVGPVRLCIEVVFEIPVSWPARIRETAKNGSMQHIGSPDLDNIVKLVQDALNGVVYLDDRQICELAARKRYGEAERVEVVIDELVTISDHPALLRSLKRVLEAENEITPRGTAKPRRRTSRVAVKDKPLGKRIK